MRVGVVVDDVRSVEAREHVPGAAGGVGHVEQCQEIVLLLVVPIAAHRDVKLPIAAHRDVKPEEVSAAQDNN